MSDLFLGALVWCLVAVFGSVSLACLALRFPAVVAYLGVS